MEVKRIKLPFKVTKSILALGSQAKNTVCFAERDFAYLSRVHQNLDDPRDYSRFEKDVKYFLKKNPKIIAYDPHPEYQSSKYALSILRAKRYTISAIQHHHAHIASCMAENGLNNQKVIGVAFDGTGLGADDSLWGAEFLLCDYKNFKRAAHFKELPLLGGEMAIMEPWRLAALWLYLIYGDKFLRLDIDFVRGIDKKNWGVLEKMYLSGINSPLASSAGRLFDAAASLIFAKSKVSFEAELAIGLEKAASIYQQSDFSYSYDIMFKEKARLIDPAPMFKEIVIDLKKNAAKEKIAYGFHFTLAKIIKEICSGLRKETDINKVVLTGGVFQNNLLTRLSSDALLKSGFKVFKHKELSCNDSSISLGQAAIANQR